MNDGIKYFLTFVIGATIGAVATNVIVRDKYAKEAEEDIRALREFYEKKYPEEATDDDEESQDEEFSEDVQKEYRKIASQYDRKDDAEIVGPVDYARRKKEREVKIVNREDVFSPENVRVCDPDEFGENPDYITTNMTYFADGYLIDDMSHEVVDIEDTIGQENIDQMGKYEEGILELVNDAEGVYYEITAVEDHWKE